MNSIPISTHEFDWELVKGKTISEVDPRGWGEPEIKFEDGSRLLILPVFMDGDEDVEVVLEQPSDLFNIVRKHLAELVESRAMVKLCYAGMITNGRISWCHGWYRVDSIRVYYFRLEDVDFTRVEFIGVKGPNSWSIHLSKDCDPTKGGW